LRCQFQVVAPRQHGAGQAVRVGEMGFTRHGHGITLTLHFLQDAPLAMAKSAQVALWVPVFTSPRGYSND
jgi:hypothetical protein